LIMPCPTLKEGSAMRRVVVTGLGLVTPCGSGVGRAWNSAVEARSGVAPITHFDVSDLVVKIAAMVKDFDIGDALDAKDAKRTTRFVQFAVAAAREALRDAGLDEPSTPH